MNPAVLLAVIGLSIAGIAAESMAYEILTHQDLTEAAADRSVLTLDPSVLKNLGLERGVRDQTQTFPNSKRRERRILDLLRDGAEFEDDAVPVLGFTRHFYNPVTGLGLNITRLPTQTASPDWALQGGQEFSYLHARQYLLDALTRQSESDRRRAFGLTFQTLGHVVHHLQDMAQPQHVRNDVHCPFQLCRAIGAYAPSLYEKWTDGEAVRGGLPRDPALVGYDATTLLFISTFNSPRRFWHTEQPGPSSVASGKGIAEFTNRNFLSAGTNFDFVTPRLFPSPVLDESRKMDMDIQALCTNANPPCLNPNLHGTITFYGNVVEDRLTGQATNNPFASSLSIFDADLRNVTGTSLSQPLLFTLNRFNFALAHGYLIPRAVAYSTGMINYFFRGDIRIGPNPAQPNSVTPAILNYTKEPISGDVKIYYETNANSRLELRAINNITLPAAGPAGPTTSWPVSFEEPEPFRNAKRPLQYTLVFTGDMGEERRTQSDPLGAVTGRQLSVVYGAPNVSDFRYFALAGVAGDVSGAPFPSEQGAIDAAQLRLREYVRGAFNPVFNCEAFTLGATPDWPSPPERTIWGIEFLNRRTIPVLFPQSCAGMNGKGDITLVRDRTSNCPAGHFRTVRPGGGESLQEACYTLASP